MDLAVGRPIVPAHTGRDYRADSRTPGRDAPRLPPPRLPAYLLELRRPVVKRPLRHRGHYHYQRATPAWAAHKSARDVAAGVMRERWTGLVTGFVTRFCYPTRNARPVSDQARVVSAFASVRCTEWLGRESNPRHADFPSIPLVRARTRTQAPRCANSDEAMACACSTRVCACPPPGPSVWALLPGVLPARGITRPSTSYEAHTRNTAAPPPFGSDAHAASRYGSSKLQAPGSALQRSTRQSLYRAVHRLLLGHHAASRVSAPSAAGSAAASLGPPGRAARGSRRELRICGVSPAFWPVCCRTPSRGRPPQSPVLRRQRRPPQEERSWTSTCPKRGRRFSG